MKNRVCAFIVLLLFTVSQLYAEDDTLPAPYKPEEFPQWTLDLRRAEVVTVGSFPLTFMLTALVYDISYYAIDYGNYSSDPDSYDRATYGTHRTQDDIKKLLLISGGLSLTVGITDFIINKIRQNRKEKAEQEKNEQRRNNGESSRVGEDSN